MARPSPRFHLTKTKYIAGLQCVKRLWLASLEPGLQTPPDAAQQAIFDQGNRVGEAAWELFPGGVLVAERPWEHAQAVARTQQLMEDPKVPAIFEAAFEHSGVRVRVDVLERLGAVGWGLREVKAAASVKDVHIDDVAVQRFVLEGAGVSVGSVELVHIDTRYVRGGGSIDWGELFLRADLTAESAERVPAIAERVEEFEALLSQSAAPRVEPDRHCFDPHSCEFWEHCTRGKPSDWTYHLPRISSTDLEVLRGRGVERIGDIPEDFSLSATQARVRDAHREARPWVSGDLSEALRDSGPPAFYLDFESMNPAIPLFAGARPFEVIPFQWSLHQRSVDDEITHSEFLAPSGVDPRRPFAESLIAAVGEGTDPILVYSSFEATRLCALEEIFPDLATRLAAIRDRLVDLLPVVRQNIYHPDFRGSFSLKAVAPVLASSIRYDDLDSIADGSAAAAAIEQLARSAAAPEEERAFRSGLLEYCKRDTIALLELHRTLETASVSGVLDV